MIQYNDQGSGVITLPEPEVIQRQMNHALDEHDHKYENLQDALDDFAAIHWAWQIEPIIEVNGVKYVPFAT